MQILVEGLFKNFQVARRKGGLYHAFRSVLHREYHTVCALDGVSFQIGAGELVGYIGPNGAGKSTTVKIMSGILVPDAGRCEILGRVPWRSRVEHVANLGVVFGQRTQLWWDVPVMDSFELLRDIYRVPEDSYRRTRDELVEGLSLEPLLETPVRQLSLGQRIKCELAASMLHRPPILFLDEPTIGLDAISKLAVRDFVRNLNQTMGTTVILTTHDMDDIEALCSRVLLLSGGKILFDGSIRTLKAAFLDEKRLVVDFLEVPGRGAIGLEGVRTVCLKDNQLELRYDPTEVSISELVQRLSRLGQIRDITVEEPPIEEVIARIYGEMAL